MRFYLWPFWLWRNLILNEILLGRLLMDFLQFERLQNGFFYHLIWWLLLRLLSFAAGAVFKLFIKWNSLGAFDNDLHLRESEQIFLFYFFLLKHLFLLLSALILIGYSLAAFILKKVNAFIFSTQTGAGFWLQSVCICLLFIIYLLNIFDNDFRENVAFIFMIIHLYNVLWFSVIAAGGYITAKLLPKLLLLPAEFVLDHLAIELLVLRVVTIVLDKVNDFLYFFAVWGIFLTLMRLKSITRLLLSISIRLLFSSLLLNFVSVVTSFHF